MRNGKRAQLTMFVFIALVIVIVFVIGFFLYQQSSRGQFNHDSRIIRDFYTSCLDNKLDDGLHLLARQGGYYKINQTILASFIGEKTSFYFLNGHILVPSLENVQDELSNYVNDHINDCKGEFNQFSVNTNIECNKPQILNQTVMECTLNVEKDKYHKMFDLKIYGPSLLKQLNASNKIISNYAEKPGYVCIECLDQIASKHKVNISVVPITTQVNATKDMAWFFVKPLNETERINKINQANQANKALTLRFAVSLE